MKWYYIQYRYREVLRMASLVSYNTNVVFNYLNSIECDREFQMHFHDIYEIYYFVDGEADYFVEGKQYRLKPDSLLLLAPHAIHGVRVNSPKPYKRYTIHFDADLVSIDRRAFLLSAFSDSKHDGTHEVYYQNLDNFDLYPYFDALTNCNHLPKDLSEKLTAIHIEALLAKLVEMRRSLHYSDEGITLSKTVVAVTNYINQHLTENITLDGLCEQFYVSKVHLNRIFTKSIGTTVFEYIAYKRIALARRLLENGVPAREAAIYVGYNDYSTFFRAYKKITGCAPTYETFHYQE